MKKPLFYLLIFSLFLNISSCKKVFDKDYYKDCVGEDRVSGDAIGLIPFRAQESLPFNSTDYWFQIENDLFCSNDRNEICRSISVVTNDSLANYIFKLKQVIGIESQNYISQLESIDTIHQSIILIRYYYFETPSYPYYFVSNLYDVRMDEDLNELTVFYERRGPAKYDREHTESFKSSGCHLIINGKVNNNTKLKFMYYENECR